MCHQITEVNDKPRWHPDGLSKVAGKEWTGRDGCKSLVPGWELGAKGSEEGTGNLEGQQGSFQKAYLGDDRTLPGEEGGEAGIRNMKLVVVTKE